jgi:hypothetical protein
MGLPNQVDQVAQVRVDLVLNERSCRARAAVSDLATLDQDYQDPFASKAMGHERAGDAGADDRDVAAPVLFEAGIGR